MATTQSDILLHPVRLRIVLTTAGDEATTADIARRLPDVPQATLYRHIAKLADAGILDVVGERQARGAIEKTYRVNASRASIKAAEASEMSAEEHFEAFTTFAGVLIETYGRYLNTPGSEPAADGVSFRQARLWLTDHERYRSTATGDSADFSTHHGRVYSAGTSLQAARSRDASMPNPLRLDQSYRFAWTRVRPSATWFSLVIPVVGGAA